LIGEITKDKGGIYFQGNAKKKQKTESFLKETGNFVWHVPLSWVFRESKEAGGWNFVWCFSI